MILKVERLLLKSLATPKNTANYAHFVTAITRINWLLNI